MKEKISSFETSDLAKEKGFEGYNNGYYYKDTGTVNAFYCYYSDGLRNENYSDSLCCQAPTQGLLQQWLREVHDIGVYVLPYNKDLRKYYEVSVGSMTYSGYESYEEALEAGLIEGLKMIENTNIINQNI